MDKSGYQNSRMSFFPSTHENERMRTMMVMMLKAQLQRNAQLDQLAKTLEQLRERNKQLEEQLAKQKAHEELARLLLGEESEEEIEEETDEDMPRTSSNVDEALRSLLYATTPKERDDEDIEEFNLEQLFGEENEALDEAYSLSIAIPDQKEGCDDPINALVDELLELFDDGYEGDETGMTIDQVEEHCKHDLDICLELCEEFLNFLEKDEILEANDEEEGEDFYSCVDFDEGTFNTFIEEEINEENAYIDEEIDNFAKLLEERPLRLLNEFSDARHRKLYIEEKVDGEKGLAPVQMFLDCSLRFGRASDVKSSATWEAPHAILLFCI